MKRFTLLTALLILCSLLASQTPAGGSTSKIKEFLGTTGALLIKEFHNVGTHKCQFGDKLVFDALVITDATSKKVVKGLKIEATKPGSYVDETESAFLDPEEVNSLIDALNYMVAEHSRLGSVVTLTYTEYIYAAKDAFRIGFYIDKGEYHAFAKVGTIGAISVYFPFNDLATILSYVIAGRDKLANL